MHFRDSVSLTSEVPWAGCIRCALCDAVYFHPHAPELAIKTY